MTCSDWLRIPRRTRRTRRIFFEQLEGRSLLAATITVNSVLDTDARDSALTLREAILVNNGTLPVTSLTATEKGQIVGTPESFEMDTIAFNIPGAGVRTIHITTGLPNVTDPVTVDGYTQPGASPNTNAIDDPDPNKRGFNGTLLIELSAQGLVLNGLTLASLAAGSVVRGLVVNQFSTGISLGSGSVVEGCLIGTDATGTLDRGNRIKGIVAAGSNSRIGGTSPASRNIVSSNGRVGIEVADFGSGGPGNVVQGNFVGTDASGTKDLGDGQVGVRLYQVFGATVGGTQSGARNVIAGNDVGINVEVASSNTIQGNYIGVDVTGAKALGNSGAGIVLDIGGATLIGGTTAAARNVISGNGAGIFVGGSENVIQGNFIGMDASGTMALGNTHEGIHFYRNEVENIVGGSAAGAANTIAFNGGNGIYLKEGYRNSFLTNSIYANGGSGIDIEPSGGNPNDAGDGDNGANFQQNFPEIRSVTRGGATLTVEYVVPSLPTNSVYPLRVEFFKADSDGEEGQAFFGFDTYQVAEAGTVKSVTFAPATGVVVGDRIVATATDGGGNTSEFSASIPVGCSLVVMNTNDSGPGSLREAITCGNNLPNIDRDGISGVDPDPITFAIPANDPRHFYYRNDAVNGGLTNITPTNASDDATISNIDPDWRHSWYSIEVNSALPAIIEAVSIDGFTQTGASENTSGITLAVNAVLRIEVTESASTASSGISGIVLTANHNTVRGLVINRFDVHGIEVRSNGNIVSGNYIGTNVAATRDQGNGSDGVHIDGTSGNLVGGIAAAGRNYIRGNGQSGIALVNGAYQNSVQGNAVVRNSLTPAQSDQVRRGGILIDESPGNIIGGTSSGSGNAVGGSSRAVMIVGESAHDNVVVGNTIGFGSANGVFVWNAHDNRIGGTTAGARNVIWAVGTGVRIESSNSPAASFNNWYKGISLGQTLQEMQWVFLDLTQAYR